MIEDHEIPPGGVDHVEADFGAYVSGRRVVPNTVGARDEVDEGIDGAVGDRADVDGRRAHRPDLPTTEIVIGSTRHRHH